MYNDRFTAQQSSPRQARANPRTAVGAVTLLLSVFTIVIRVYMDELALAKLFVVQALRYISA
jgi:hypothetical protein